MNKIIICFVLMVCVSGAFAAPASDTDDLFQFFSEEAEVISASRLHNTVKLSPATVYVVTGQDIKDSGAQNIWDALRSVPGVDVIQLTPGQGEVSIRGMAKPANTRTMILLDGRKALNSFSDFITWSELPVTLQEIDRIEIVQGPASAIYGANAVNGAINIITKSPDRFQGGLVSYSVSERSTALTSFDYGRKLDKWAYRFGGGRDSANSFEHADQLSSRSGKVNFFSSYKPAPDNELKFSGGLTDMNTVVSAPESTGQFTNNGRSGFLDVGYSGPRTQYRAYWTHFAANLLDYPAAGDIYILSESFFAEAQREISLASGHELLIGANMRQDSARSSIIEDRARRNSQALLVEDRWAVSDKWVLQGSARLDRHPYIHDMISSRGSVIFVPAPEQSLRLSAGTAFKPPTLMENSVHVSVNIPNLPGSGFPLPWFTDFYIATQGNARLSPERIKTVELSYAFSIGPVNAAVTGYHNTIRKLIYPTGMAIVGTPVPPSGYLSATYGNTGDIRIYGGELALSARLIPAVYTYANYSYQRLKDSPGEQILSRQSPVNKVNAGLRFKKSAWTANLDGNWVDVTRWVSAVRQPRTVEDLRKVKSYLLLSAHAGYAFRGRLKGLEAGLSVFNLLNHKHYQTLPALSPSLPGQSAELMRARVTGTLQYKF